MLAIIAVLGVIYALPNLYPEQPVIQISSNSSSHRGPSIDDLVAKVSTGLQKKNVPYKAISQQGQALLIRFKNTDAQLKAKDVLKQIVGEKYTVALNLAPSTPIWLSLLGAEPMKQGLDLRGGVHFLLDVDVQGVINRRIEGIKKNIGQELRQLNIRYTNLSVQAHQILSMRFKDVTQSNRA